MDGHKWLAHAPPSLILPKFTSPIALDSGYYLEACGVRKSTSTKMFSADSWRLEPLYHMLFDVEGSHYAGSYIMQRNR